MKFAIQMEMMTILQLKMVSIGYTTQMKYNPNWI